MARTQRPERADGRSPGRYLGGWRRIGRESTQLVERRKMRARAFAMAAPRDRRQPGCGRRVARSGWSVAGGPMLLATVIVGAIAAGLLPLPESVAAAWSRSGDRTSERIEPHGPQADRARPERRRASPRALRDEVRALAAEVDALERRRDRISDLLQSARQQKLALEQRLDYLVPRLLAREAKVRAQRARMAQALAELAAQSRRVHLDSTARARTLAIGPVMLERLRSVASNLGSVRHPEQAMQRYAQIARSLSDLTTERQDLSGELAQTRRQRRAALERLRELDVDLRHPAEEQARLADRFLLAETAVPAPAEPRPDRGVRRDLAKVREAGVAGARDAGLARVREAGVARVREAGVAGVREAGMAGAGVARVREAGLAGMRAGGMAEVREAGLAGVRAAGVAGVREAGVAGAREAGLAGVREAGVAGADGAPGRPLRAVRIPQAEHRSASQVLAAAPAADLDGPVSLAGEAGWPTTATSARPLRPTLHSEGPQIWPGASHHAISRAAPLDVAFAPPRRLPAMAVAGGATPLLLPVAEAGRGRGATRRDHPEITIAAAPGQGVAAPVDGTIVFADRFKSYGLLLIIEHEREYHTLLWGFAWLDVSLGDYVQAGQVVGIMGARGDDPPVLHVERRRNGQPINLAARSSGIQG